MSEARAMRMPSDRYAAWAPWRERIAGADKPIHESSPECGLYKLRRDGRWALIQIDLVQALDDDGALIDDEGPIAWCNGKPIGMSAVWPRCAANPVTPDEFDRIARVPAARDLSRQVIT